MTAIKFAAIDLQTISILGAAQNVQDDGQKETKQASTQTKAKTEKECAEVWTQAVKRADANIQVDPMVSEVEFAHVDNEVLSDFLKTAGKRMFRELERAQRQRHLFLRRELAMSAASDYSLIHSKTLQQRNDLAALRVAWSCSSATLAVAYGVPTHDDWCDHAGMLCAWNVSRRSLQPNKADFVWDLSACPTSLCFHSREPPVLAVGTATGQVLVLNVGVSEQADAIIASSNIEHIAHRDAVSTLTWLTEHRNQLLSSGLDGKLFLWQLPDRGTELALQRAFVIVSETLPRTVRGNKLTTTDKEVGITSLAMAGGADKEAFFVGTEPGAVFQCSLASTESLDEYAYAANNKDVPFFSPVSIALAPMAGPVYAIASNSQVIAACGADHRLAVYRRLHMQPICVIDTGTVALTHLAFAHARTGLLLLARADGSALAYDFTKSSIDPTATYELAAKDTELHCVAFSKSSSSVLATADGAGSAKIWTMGDAYHSSMPFEERVFDDMTKTDAET